MEKIEFLHVTPLESSFWFGGPTRSSGWMELQLQTAQEQELAFGRAVRRNEKGIEDRLQSDDACERVSHYVSVLTGKIKYKHKVPDGVWDD
jgi:hypothetical protein